LKEWFENSRSSNLPVSGVIKAMHIAKRLQIETVQDIRLFWKIVKTQFVALYIFLVLGN
jgi:hypothetical protein